MTKQTPATHPFRHAVFSLLLWVWAPFCLAEDTLNHAINTYLKGFDACTQANDLLLSDAGLARERMSLYQQFLDEATVINDAILTTTERGMPSNLQFCQRVADNISRALATPMLEHAFTFCQSARDALTRDDLVVAEGLLEDYQNKKEEAFSLSNTLMDVYLLASQVRSCERLQERLADRQQTLAQQHAAITEALTLSERFKLECESTLAYVTSNRFTILHIDQANAMLAAAQTNKQASQAVADAKRFATDFPTHDLTLNWQSTLSSARVCEGQVTDRIRAAVQERATRKETLNAANNRLLEAQRYCERASALSEPTRTREELAEARIQHQESTLIMDQIIEQRTPVQYAKLYPNWEEGKQFRTLSARINECHVSAAHQIKQLQIVLDSQDKPSLSEQPLTETEKRAAEEALAAEPLDDPLLEDWPLDDADEETDKARNARRDWTDLVR